MLNKIYTHKKKSDDINSRGGKNWIMRHEERHREIERGKKMVHTHLKYG